MSAVSVHPAPPQLAMGYVDADPARVLADDRVLAVIGFGAGAPPGDDPRHLRVALEPHGPAPLEVWRSARSVQRGRDGDLAWACDGALMFGALELAEPAVDPAGAAADRDGDIEATATASYRRLVDALEAHGYPHLLRVWNYLDGITVGDGDGERYRRFCVGRARGLGDVDVHRLPAATAIGRVDGVRRLQVYWLAARAPGTPLENPRQVSAYRYPRQYGPQPPSFARAMLPASPAMPLLLSGTAAITGHESRHAGSVAAQFDETLANLDTLVAAARARRPELPAAFGAGSPLKVYVRERDELAAVAALLEDRLPADVPRLVLHAAVCRRELRIEVDGAHG